MLYVVPFDLQSDGLASQSLYEDLHPKKLEQMMD
jgi:hypothetical protein